MFFPCFSLTLFLSLSHSVLVLTSLQILSRANDQEPCGWWLAKVRMMKGDVSIAPYEDKYLCLVNSIKSIYNT